MTETTDVFPYQWGESPDGWMVRQLAEVSGRITDGTHAPPERVDSGGVPLLGSGEASLYGLDFDDASMVSKQDYKEMSDKDKPNVGDILLPVVGTLGEPYLVEEDREFAVQRSLAIISPDDSISQEYLTQTLQSEQVERQIKSRSRQSVQAGLYLSELKKLEVPMPPVGEQERIASVLYTVDQHVDALSQRHDYLTDLKHALMQDLLTGRKQLVEDDTSKSGFTASEPNKRRELHIAPKIFDVPIEWESKEIGEISPFVVDGTHSTPDYADDGVRFISTQNLLPFREKFDFESYERFITKEKHDELCDRYEPQVGDILISKNGTIGRCQAVRTDEDFNIFVGLAAIRPEEVSSGYLEQFLNWDVVTKILKSRSPGSTRATLTLGDLSRLTVPIPPREEQERIASVLYTVDEMIARTGDLRDEYEQLKRGLMQDLLSGDVRTPETLEVLSEVVQSANG